MMNPSCFDEHLLHPGINRIACCSGKVLTLFLFVIGLSMAVMLTMVSDLSFDLQPWTTLTATSGNIDLASTYPRSMTVQQFERPAGVQHLIEPASSRTLQPMQSVKVWQRIHLARMHPVRAQAEKQAEKQRLWQRFLPRLPGAPKRLSLIGGAPKKVKSLVPWLESKGLPEQDVVLSYDVSEGRGLTAGKAINEGSTLLRIPEAAFVSVGKAMDGLGGAERCNGLSEWSILAAWLAGEKAAGESSDFAPYVSALPTACGSVLEWDAIEVETLLKGSPTQIEAQGRRRSIEEAIPEILERIPDRNLDTESLRWAFSMLFSRLLRLEALGGEMVLCPWADMMNHKPGVKAFFDYDKSSNAVVLTVDRDYDEGEQVFISYGQRSSAELMLSYGFVPPAGNPDEAVEVTLGLQKSDPMYDVKAAALARRDMKAVKSFPVKMAGLPEELLAYAAFVATPVDSEAKVEQLAVETIDRAEVEEKKGPLDGIKLPWGGGEKNKWEVEPKVAGRQLLIQVLQRIQAGYENTLQEDREQAQKAATRGAMAETKEGRRTAAAAVRARERVILTNADRVLRTQEKERKYESNPALRKRDKFKLPF
eukprot:gnl/MRDRNA2_/MRDRNA2_71500_c0_seq1.p1 gnl/MRDRNA2_/MRDRNA2_71500_c0~~gnl/MRDRNA2_/MRDRNA2_71500_c0_seq1.p1  ORF type:complete len:593 (+),score=120.55 gnl/MRDRNA2_/MRDRNA2_71500_c0_seq1:55-1833(+)